MIMKEIYYKTDKQVIIITKFDKTTRIKQVFDLELDKKAEESYISVPYLERFKDRYKTI